MKTDPIYTANEIKQMCLNFDSGAFKILADLMDEELDLYDEEDLAVLCQASIILFCRAVINNIKW